MQWGWGRRRRSRSRVVRARVCCACARRARAGAGCGCALRWPGSRLRPRHCRACAVGPRAAFRAPRPVLMWPSLLRFA
eukprot:scaffold46319_cov275-Isochrysis_galbana.AAC.1